jgi:hypothetical protein
MQFLRENNNLARELGHAKKILEQVRLVEADLRRTNLKLEASKEQAVSMLKSSQQEVSEKEEQLKKFRKLVESMAPPSPSNNSVRKMALSSHGHLHSEGLYARRVSDAGTGMHDNMPPVGSDFHPSRNSSYDRLPPSPHGGIPKRMPNLEAHHSVPSNGGMTRNPSTERLLHQSQHVKQGLQHHRVPSESHSYLTSDYLQRNRVDTTYKSQRYHSEQHSNHPSRIASQQIHQQQRTAPKDPSSINFTSSQNRYEQRMPTAQSAMAPPTGPYAYETTQAATRQQFGSSGASIASKGSQGSGSRIRDFNAVHPKSFLSGSANGRHLHASRPR